MKLKAGFWLMNGSASKPMVGEDGFAPPWVLIPPTPPDRDAGTYPAPMFGNSFGTLRRRFLARALSSPGRRSLKLLLGPKMNSLVSVGLKVCVNDNTPLRPGRGNEIGESGKFRVLAKLP